MPFSPALPFGGLAGYRFLERTYDRQLELFNKSPDVQRDIDYFLENAGNVISALDITSDPPLLRVVLGAYGLEEDINKQAFVRKVIAEGTIDPDAFSNRLVESAYREMSEAVGIGNFGSRLNLADVRQDFVERYRVRQFEVAAGEVDVDLRLALNFERRAPELIADVTTDRTGWLRLLGSPPIRQVIESAFNLPAEFAQVDLDQQVEEIQDRALSLLGTKSPSALSDPDVTQRLVERFLLRSQLENGAIGASTPGATALSLLQSSGLGSSAQNNLFQSLF